MAFKFLEEGGVYIGQSVTGTQESEGVIGCVGGRTDIVSTPLKLCLQEEETSLS